MPHILADIDTEIDRLIHEAGENAELVQRLENLKTKAHAVDLIIQQSTSEEETRHEVLHDVENWLKKAGITDTDFETQLDDMIVLLDQYD